MTDDTATDFDIKRYLGILQRRRYLVLAVALYARGKILIYGLKCVFCRESVHKRISLETHLQLLHFRVDCGRPHSCIWFKSLVNDQA